MIRGPSFFHRNFPAASFALAGIAFSVLASGCSAEVGEGELDEASSEDALIVSPESFKGTFKLYGQPNFTPDPMCDIHTSLTLEGSPIGSPRARLHDAVTGTCKIFVEPQTRQFRLRLARRSCGSMIYTGHTVVFGARREITITDHRSRLCRDIVPAKIIVEERDAQGGSYTRYSFDGKLPAPEPTSTWLTTAPKQCGTNVWNNAGELPGVEPSSLQGEAGEVDNYFRSVGVRLEKIGFAYPAEPLMTCMACSCPRGDTLVVQAASSEDAQKLISQYGFTALTGALTTSPTQCGTSPWEAGQQTEHRSDESRWLSSWSAQQGAPLSLAGFVQLTEPQFVCRACQCPRGDLALALPQDADAANKLENLGWTRVEN